MRLLLVLLALLSGLSLAEVTASSARSEVVGSTSSAVPAAVQAKEANVSHAKALLPACEARSVRTVILPVLAFIRAISISIWDRPLE